jgi:hypothetical protein
MLFSKLNIYEENLKSVRGTHLVLGGSNVARGPDVAKTRSQSNQTFFFVNEVFFSVFVVVKLECL